MDNDVIEQLFYGNLVANERDIKRGSAQDKACRAFADAEALLTLKLSGEEKRALLALTDAHSEILGASERECFCRGFRLGAMLIMDVFARADELFEED